MDMAIMQKLVDVSLKTACNGRLTIKVLDKLYEGKIEPNSTICADKHNVYKKFADCVPAELIQIEKVQHKKGN